MHLPLSVSINPSSQEGHPSTPDHIILLANHRIQGPTLPKMLQWRKTCQTDIDTHHWQHQQRCDVRDRLRIFIENHSSYCLNCLLRNALLLESTVIRRILCNWIMCNEGLVEQDVEFISSQFLTSSHVCTYHPHPRDDADITLICISSPQS